MFNFFKKFTSSKDVNHDNHLITPATGKAVSINEISDEVFSERILGDGVAVVPSENIIFSPMEGEVIQVAETNHAFCIKGKNGLDVLIHIGVDTVTLKGKGFKSYVKVGQKVHVGKKIAKADFNLISNAGLQTHVIMIITNMSKLAEFNTVTGNVKAGEDEVITFRMK